AANHGPSRDWLTIVHTSEARNKIRGWFKKERREENIQQGRADLEREMSRNLIRIPEERLEQFLMAQAKRQHCTSLDDFFAAIGYGGVMLSRLIPRMKEEYARMQREEQLAVDPIKPVTAPPRRRHVGGVVIDQMDDCLVKFAQCCNPVPGDAIIGFITRGYGVSIHRCDCTNVPKNMDTAPNKERWITVQWEQSVNTDFNANLRIVAHEQSNLLLKLATTLSNLHVAVHSLNARDVEDGSAVVMMTVAVNSVEHLQYIIQKLRAVPGVNDVQRTGM
ncbi:MAG: bifunctional (p)ppGpp synthetase/guanosine-3',5'-bis(diphosphate) 3'-pyrophosphohydrolase, partial [Clostridia bacterium]|nr:bifunctional (p)ppGpp synthetase/guanosine-3',5'-bis(diphosphate) 3'-pyrophosphohydrolase [Clostridia bacterium]